MGVDGESRSGRAACSDFDLFTCSTFHLNNNTLVVRNYFPTLNTLMGSTENHMQKSCSKTTAARVLSKSV